MRDKILIFGGTTEGRLFAARLSELGIKHVVSVATEYGRLVEEESGEDSLLVGRLGIEEIAEILKSGEYAAVVDATHPYAVRASEEISKACESDECIYIRLSRKDSENVPVEEKVIYVHDNRQAAKELEKCEGKILLLTGSRDLKEITEGISDKSRIYVRIIPDISSIEKCMEAGLLGRQIIAMQGPFSAAMNEALIREIDASVMLTKDSGAAGGFASKIKAARNCGIRTVIINNPEKSKQNVKGLCFEEALDKVQQILGMDRIRKITLSGIGPGDERYYTSEFIRALKGADIIFGAASVLQRIEHINTTSVNFYEGEKIWEYLEDHPKFRSPLAVFSGDISLCSGAKKAGEFLEKKGYRVEKIAGISSVSLFAGKIGASLEETRVLSAHGRNLNVNGFVRQNKKVIVLPSDSKEALEIAKSLPKGCEVIFGCELGTKNEKILNIRARDFDPCEVKGKVLLYIANPEASLCRLIPSLKDSDIIRGDVPMTKEEVRGISLRKLELTNDSILWDVGAGTGSISLEAALAGPCVKVFSVEKNEKAVNLLEQNREKFGLGNIEIVWGEAPEALKNLPAPSHVFIGGSSGKISDIINCAAQNNKRKVRFVVNCVTLETLTNTMEAMDKFGAESREVVQISATRFKEHGPYHMADSINPVFVITFEV